MCTKKGRGKYFNPGFAGHHTGCWLWASRLVNNPKCNDHNKFWSSLTLSAGLNKSHWVSWQFICKADFSFLLLLHHLVFYVQEKDTEVLKTFFPIPSFAHVRHSCKTSFTILFNESCWLQSHHHYHCHLREICYTKWYSHALLDFIIFLLLCTVNSPNSEHNLQFVHYIERFIIWRDNSIIDNWSDLPKWSLYGDVHYIEYSLYGELTVMYNLIIPIEKFQKFILALFLLS